MGYISVRNAHKEFMKDGEPLTILEDINLDIEKGEFICLLGPSGSGKSTLLNAMAGFELVTSGSITINGEEVKAPQLRYVTVFQNYGLLPWRTVESNIELGLESKKVPKEERPAIIDKYVKMVGLDHARNRYPAELSGGMQQRVSIARALAVDPDIIFIILLCLLYSASFLQCDSNRLICFAFCLFVFFSSLSDAVGTFSRGT